MHPDIFKTAVRRILAFVLFLAIGAAAMAWLLVLALEAAEWEMSHRREMSREAVQLAIKAQAFESQGEDVKVLAMYGLLEDGHEREKERGSGIGDREKRKAWNDQGAVRLVSGRAPLR